MSEPVTQQQFFTALQQLREEFNIRHANLREHIDDGFERLSDKLELHKHEDDAVKSRVQKIENEREMEERAAVKRGTLLGLIGGASVTIITEAMHRIFK